MRLFVAVRPPADVIDAIDALPRPSTDGVRWTTRDQWHATLRFFGEVDGERAIVDALRTAPLDECTATIRRGAAMLGRGVVQLPIDGLDALATAVVDATSAFGQPAPTRRFRGHLTLARTKRRAIDMAALAVDCRWTVREIELIRSHLGRGGARYETLTAVALRGG